MNTGLFPAQIKVLRECESEFQMACEQVIKDTMSRIATNMEVGKREGRMWPANFFGDVSYAHRCTDHLNRAVEMLQSEVPTAPFSTKYAIQELLACACEWSAWQEVQVNQAERFGQAEAEIETVADVHAEALAADAQAYDTTEPVAPAPANKPRGLRSLLTKQS